MTIDFKPEASNISFASPIDREAGALAATILLFAADEGIMDAETREAVFDKVDQFKLEDRVTIDLENNTQRNIVHAMGWIAMKMDNIEAVEAPQDPMLKRLKNFSDLFEDVDISDRLDPIKTLTDTLVEFEFIPKPDPNALPHGLKQQ